MSRYCSLSLNVEWCGPFSLAEVLLEFNRGGSPPEYDGEDYGLYQIYGKHILAGDEALLYIGKAIRQTFAQRFTAHKAWIEKEEGIAIYLGTAHDKDRHFPGRNNEWSIWEADLGLAERVLIYKYSPNYNGASISDPPSLNPYSEVVLNHSGARHKLHHQDRAPEDW